MLGEFQDENVQRFNKSANFCKKTRKILLNITNKKYVQYKQLSQTRGGNLKKKNSSKKKVRTKQRPRTGPRGKTRFKKKARNSAIDQEKRQVLRTF